ncbi:hypothetical protein ACMHYP_23215 [Bacillus cereus]|uniref:hypothetical protein n=2 Tax=Bacillus TaxID=1386 RepID=UPI0011C8B473|nr:hypothetical protein DN395_00100 [Bacillus sp. AR18-7]
MHKRMKLRKLILSCFSILFITFSIMSINSSIAYAKDLKEEEKNMNAFQDINVFESKQKVDDKSSLKGLNTLVVLSLTVGGFVVVFNIVASGIRLSTSQNNPSARNTAIAGLGFSLLGGWMIYRCLNIVGWFGSIYNNSKTGKDGLVSDLNTLLVMQLGVGGFIVVMSIIYAGSKLAASQNNPNARVQAFGGVGTALIGAYIVYKALSIAGWVGNI